MKKERQRTDMSKLLRKKQMVRSSTPVSRTHTLHHGQYSGQLVDYHGHHQTQAFYRRVHLSGPRGFRRTVHLTQVVALDISGRSSPVLAGILHLFERELGTGHVRRLVTFRLYFPVSRLRSANESKVVLQRQRRVHLQPNQYEFVVRPDLVTLSIEVFAECLHRAESSMDQLLNCSMLLPDSFPHLSSGDTDSSCSGDSARSPKSIGRRFGSRSANKDKHPTFLVLSPGIFARLGGLLRQVDEGLVVPNVDSSPSPSQSSNNIDHSDVTSNTEDTALDVIIPKELNLSLINSKPISSDLSCSTASSLKDTKSFSSDEETSLSNVKQHILDENQFQLSMSTSLNNSCEALPMTLSDRSENCSEEELGSDTIKTLDIPVAKEVNNSSLSSNIIQNTIVESCSEQFVTVGDSSNLLNGEDEVMLSDSLSASENHLTKKSDSSDNGYLLISTINDKIAPKTPVLDEQESNNKTTEKSFSFEKPKLYSTNQNQETIADNEALDIPLITDNSNLEIESDLTSHPLYWPSCGKWIGLTKGLSPGVRVVVARRYSNECSGTYKSNEIKTFCRPRLRRSVNKFTNQLTVKWSYQDPSSSFQNNFFSLNETQLDKTAQDISGKIETEDSSLLNSRLIPSLSSSCNGLSTPPSRRLCRSSSLLWTAALSRRNFVDTFEFGDDEDDDNREDERDLVGRPSNRSCRGGGRGRGQVSRGKKRGRKRKQFGDDKGRVELQDGSGRKRCRSAGDGLETEIETSSFTSSPKQSEIDIKKQRKRKSLLQALSAVSPSGSHTNPIWHTQKRRVGRPRKIAPVSMGTLQDDVVASGNSGPNDNLRDEPLSALERRLKRFKTTPTSSTCSSASLEHSLDSALLWNQQIKKRGRPKKRCHSLSSPSSPQHSNIKISRQENSENTPKSKKSEKTSQVPFKEKSSDLNQRLIVEKVEPKEEDGEKNGLCLKLKLSYSSNSKSPPEKSTPVKIEIKTEDLKETDLRNSPTEKTDTFSEVKKDQELPQAIKVQEKLPETAIQHTSPPMVPVPTVQPVTFVPFWQNCFLPVEPHICRCEPSCLAHGLSMWSPRYKGAFAPAPDDSPCCFGSRCSPHIPLTMVPAPLPQIRPNLCLPGAVPSAGVAVAASVIKAAPPLLKQAHHQQTAGSHNPYSSASDNINNLSSTTVIPIQSAPNNTKDCNPLPGVIMSPDSLTNPSLLMNPHTSLGNTNQVPPGLVTKLTQGSSYLNLSTINNSLPFSVPNHCSTSAPNLSLVSTPSIPCPVPSVSGLNPYLQNMATVQQLNEALVLAHHRQQQQQQRQQFQMLVDSSLNSLSSPSTSTTPSLSSHPLLAATPHTFQMAPGVSYPIGLGGMIGVPGSQLTPSSPQLLPGQLGIPFGWPYNIS